ncbi:MAG: hypothetical protein E2P02_06620 [Acidobacteria bacterium]|nr:MAG: hypothetical protein E2P02_06620 [Acidobacteriota bacterium]
MRASSPNPAGREIFYQVEAETDGDVRLMAAEYRIDGDTIRPESRASFSEAPSPWGHARSTTSPRTANAS